MPVIRECAIVCDCTFCQNPHIFPHFQNQMCKNYAAYAQIRKYSHICCIFPHQHFPCQTLF